VKVAINFLVCLWLTAASATTSAQESWQSALSRIPLGVPPCGMTELNRTNCTLLMLNAFQSNAVVKALVFPPGTTDELDFYRRVHAKLTNANPSLLDAIAALTNQTYIQAAFQPPLLLLHTTEDPLNVIAIVKNKSTAAKLHQKIVPDRVVFNDAGWDEVRAVLGRELSVGLRPFSNAPDCWHFYRHILWLVSLPNGKCSKRLPWRAKRNTPCTG